MLIIFFLLYSDDEVFVIRVLFLVHSWYVLYFSCDMFPCHSGF